MARASLHRGYRNLGGKGALRVRSLNTPGSPRIFADELRLIEAGLLPAGSTLLRPWERGSEIWPETNLGATLKQWRQLSIVVGCRRPCQ